MRVVPAICALAATACWLLGNQQASAQGSFIFHTVLMNPNPTGVFTNEFGIPVYSPGSSFPGVLSVDLNHDGVVDYRVVATGTETWGFQMEGIGANAVWARPAGGADQNSSIVPLAVGTLVEDNLPASDSWVRTEQTPFGINGPGFSTYSSAGSIGLFINQLAFAGLKFSIGADTYYGWIRVREIPFLGGGGIVYDYAYDTRPNTPTFAGAVPEPSALALFSAGIVLLILRRREQNQFGESPRR